MQFIASHRQTISLDENVPRRSMHAGCCYVNALFSDMREPSLHETISECRVH